MPNSIVSRLESFTDVASLTEWLFNYYTRECAAKFTPDVERLFDEINTDIKVRFALNAVVERKKENLLAAKFMDVEVLMRSVYSMFQHYEVTKREFTYSESHDMRFRIKKLIEIDRRFYSRYVKPILCLSFLSTYEFHNVTRIGSVICDELYETLTTDDQSLSVATGDESDEIVMMLKATRLLQLGCNEPSHAACSIFLLLSYAYFSFVLRRTRGRNHSLHCLAKMNMAALCRITGHKQKTSFRCKQVTKSILKNSHPCPSHFVEGRCLPRISSEVDIICGLVTVYQCFKTDALNHDHHLQQQQAIVVQVFSMSLFARYLQFLSTWIDGSVKPSQPTREMLKQYMLCFREIPHFFISDLLLFYTVIKKAKHREDKLLLHCTEVCPLQFTMQELRRLLVAYSVEQRTAFRQSLFDDFKSLCMIVTNDFRAMHAYR